MRDGTLIRRSWWMPDPGPETPFQEDPLLTGLQDVTARFGRGDLWQDAWSVSGAGEMPAPQKVELTLTFSQDDTVMSRFLVGAGT